MKPGIESRREVIMDNVTLVEEDFAIELIEESPTLLAHNAIF